LSGLSWSSIGCPWPPGGDPSGRCLKVVAPQDWQSASVKLGDVTLGKTEWRYRGDASRPAFVESSFWLVTGNNSPSVARSMVDTADTRNWRALPCSGNEVFKRTAWLETSLRGAKIQGYEPRPIGDAIGLRQLHLRRRCSADSVGGPTTVRCRGRPSSTRPDRQPMAGPWQNRDSAAIGTLVRQTPRWGNCNTR